MQRLPTPFLLLGVNKLMQKFDGFRTHVRSMTSDHLFMWLAGIFVAAAATVVFTVAGYFVAQWVGWVDCESHSRWGTFGDFVGGVLGPLLGFLSLIALLLTLVLQNRELEETRNELKQSRLAHEGQLAELKVQVASAERRERRDLTFRMLERWTSSEMRTCRLSAWNDLTRRFGQKPEDPVAKINLDDYRGRSPGSFEDFAEVCQFFSDLNKLFDEKLLDSELARLLFVDSVFPWFRFTDKLDFTRSGSPDSTYETEVKQWYRNRVMTLNRHITRRDDRSSLHVSRSRRTWAIETGTGE